MKARPVSPLLIGALCALFLLGSCPASALVPSASAALLMDGDSGRVLYAYHEHDRRPIASITKLMTALVAAETVSDLDTPVTVDPRAVGVEGSSMYLAAGETLTLRRLLYGLLLRSGNDAAVAIAIFCAGDVPAFVDLMNERAARLGLTDTHFANPNGLDDPEHYSSAYDMAVIGREFLKHPDLADIAATRTVSFGVRTLTNHNKLLARYEGCVGLKTGYTDNAGRTLVSAARRAGVTLLAVTLRDPNDWADHKALLDYGFEHYTAATLTSAGDPVALLPVAGSLIPCVPVLAGDTVRAALAPGEVPTARLVLPRRAEAPVAPGDVVGRIEFYLDDVLLSSAPLTAASAAPADRPGGRRGLWGAIDAPFRRPA